MLKLVFTDISSLRGTFYVSASEVNSDVTNKTGTISSIAYFTLDEKGKANETIAKDTLATGEGNKIESNNFEVSSK